MKSVFITGITGFVGSNLRVFLKNRGLNLVGVSRKPEGYEMNYEQLNETVLNDAGVFIHLAGKAHDLKKTSYDAAYFEVNTDLTKRLFDQFLESDCEPLIYISSVKIFTYRIFHSFANLFYRI